ncbi:ABC transporter ATP-binding protein, partial [Vibrio cholerae O1]|nr:ABC transporter ATP-binding protein [Vibrio cholerae O1]
RYPFVKFTPEREIGNDLLIVQNLSKTIDGEKVLDNVSFTMNPNDKAILIGDSEIAKTTLLKILAGEMEPD